MRIRIDEYGGVIIEYSKGYYSNILKVEDHSDLGRLIAKIVLVSTVSWGV
jgi:hypothetical protein